MQLKLYDKRPSVEEAQNRAPKELAVYDLLDQLGISYLRTDHVATDTMEECYEIDKVLNITICKNLFLCNRQKTQFYLLMMPGNKVFKTKELSSKINCSRLSFAPAEQMEQLLNITPGSVSIMGLMNDLNCEVSLLIDSDVLKDEYIGCHPCVNTSSLKIKTCDILEKFLPAVHHHYTEVTLCGI